MPASALGLVRSHSSASPHTTASPLCLLGHLEQVEPSLCPSVPLSLCPSVPHYLLRFIPLPGAAGVGGALVYTGLRTFLSAKTSILLQLVVPVVLLITYLFILGKPAKTLPGSTVREDQQSLISNQQGGSGRRKIKFKLINRKEAEFYLGHLKYMPHLLKYMVPLFFVYIGEYMINQGLFELLYYPNTHVGALCLDQAAQYRW